MKLRGGKNSIKIWAVLIWLAIWELAAGLLDKPIFLSGPVSVLARFFSLLPEAAFWQAVLYSLSRIVCGFALAALLGLLLAALSARFAVIKDFLAPLMLAVRSVPVASFVVLALICFTGRYLSIFISFLIALPVVYTHTLSGIENADKKLLEVATIFDFAKLSRFRYIYLPAMNGELRAALSLAIGMAWKAGTAAEVIGSPTGSIGQKLQQAKIYLETPDLLAWTLAVILLSLACEKLFLFIFDKLYHALSKA